MYEDIFERCVDLSFLKKTLKIQDYQIINIVLTGVRAIHQVKIYFEKI
jgi:hypothetical protein